MAQGLLGYILVGGRVSGLIFSSPIFGSRNYPRQLKIGIVFFLSIILAQYSRYVPGIEINNVSQFLLLMVNEILFGLFIGLIVTIFINFVYIAGDVIDYLIGFSMVSVVNPLDESQIPVSSNLFYLYSTLIFLALNLHHKLIMALVDSFNRIPIGEFFNFGVSLEYVLKIFTDALEIGIAIASPFIITILVADFILGMLSKAMPGMNIFILGMPLKIFVGMTLLLIIVPLLFNIFGEHLSNVFGYIVDYITEIGR